MIKMTDKEILVVVLREMTAYGDGWRADWSEFDGRTLRWQLEHLEKWARSSPTTEYTDGTQFSKRKP